jgi:hypothetical protein
MRIAMNWETWFCRSEWCKADSWLVRQHADQRELWQLAHEPDELRYTIAATDPICPLCGATLSLRIELAETIGGDPRMEIGPLFEYARKLAW